MTHHVDLSEIKLYSGGHKHAQAKKGEACLMEWVSIFADVTYGDNPPCTSPVLAAFGRSFNDNLPDDERQRLVSFIPRLVGTAGDPVADAYRSWMALDWLVRVHLVAWLRLAGLTDHADTLANAPEIHSKATTPLSEIRAASTAAAAAWDAARDAARDAAWDAARDAAGAAAWDAAWDAARDAAGAAARDAARDAARAAAGAAAWDAARAAAWAAAWDAAGAKLEPTRIELTQSAFQLFDQMIGVRSAVLA